MISWNSTRLPDAMPQISILIPFFGKEEELESTLVSVLENRPAQCEIIVAHGGDYSDPYDLSDEVRFVEVDTAHYSLGSVVSQVLPTIEAPILHLLSCGTTVTSGWTRGIEETFEDSYIGAVSPVLLNPDDSVFCIGVENTALYRQRFLGRGKFLAPQDYALYEPVGPSHYAGFYRVEALSEVTCLETLSDSLFGLEVALSLEAIGYENRVLESSCIRINNTDSKVETQDDSHRAIWRFAGSLGFFQGLALATLGLISDLVKSPLSRPARKSLRGRLGRFVDWNTAKQFRDFVEQARGPANTEQTLPISAYEIPLSGSDSEVGRRAA